MGFLEVLTLIFITLKLCGVITWTWLQVCIPLIVSACIYVLWFICVIINAINDAHDPWRKY